MMKFFENKWVSNVLILLAAVYAGAVAPNPNLLRKSAAELYSGKGWVSVLFLVVAFLLIALSVLGSVSALSTNPDGAGRSLAVALLVAAGVLVSMQTYSTYYANNDVAAVAVVEQANAAGDAAAAAVAANGGDEAAVAAAGVAAATAAMNGAAGAGAKNGGANGAMNGGSNGAMNGVMPVDTGMDLDLAMLESVEEEEEEEPTMMMPSASADSGSCPMNPFAADGNPNTYSGDRSKGSAPVGYDGVGFAPFGCSTGRASTGYCASA